MSSVKKTLIQSMKSNSPSTLGARVDFGGGSQKDDSFI